jgi:N-formylglutamate deformylase
MFAYHAPKSPQLPILISIPHVGTHIPQEIRQNMHSQHLKSLDDADFFLDKLYEFAPEMGIGVIASYHHRWVIDLNRPKDDAPLYQDGRVITGLVPTTTFLGEELYKDQKPTTQEIERRISEYYLPYYQKLNSLLGNIKEKFGKCLLYEAHSIRRSVPTIRPDKFPDFLLGDNDGKSAPAVFAQTFMGFFNHYYKITHNEIFKGGFITREFGKPNEQIFALQVERSKDVYMNDQEDDYDEEKAQKLQKLLKKMFLEFANILQNEGF